jgi:hypothetical protein
MVAQVFTSYAQTEVPDSAQITELKEVVVEASNQSANSKSTTYIPLPRQKKAAMDAISLLSQMAIPQLDVQPGNFNVKTITGQKVAIFINYLAASEQDLTGLNPADVKKVEYLLYPQDPRFKGAQYVVNIIVQKYEWGGYTKLMANKSFVVNSTEGSVYSKFAYKDMNFDVFANEKYLTNRHNGTQSVETFYFPDLFGQGERTVERYTTPLSSRYRNNSNDVAFRAVYSTDKVQITNKLSLNFISTPLNNLESRLSYKDDFLAASDASTIESSRNWGLNYDFDVSTSFNDNLAFDVEGLYKYGHNKQNSLYTDDDLAITNDAIEDNHQIQLTPTLVWNPNEHNSIMPLVGIDFYRSSINYLGSSPSRQKYDTYGIGGGLRYTFIQPKWSAGALFTWVYASINLTGEKIKDSYPQGNIFGTFSPNDKNQFEFYWAFGKEIPEISQKSPNMLQQDELMWYSGNPALNNFWKYDVSLQYLWLPDNKWQFAANTYYYTARDRVVTAYSPVAPNGTMLRKYVNGGNYDITMLGLSGTAKFFGGKLIAKVNPQYWHRNTSGEYSISMNEVTCTAQLTWYFGDFYLFGWYVTPSTYIPDDSGIKAHSPSSYQLQLGWGKGAWKLSATARDFFRSSWQTYRQELNSKYYDFDRYKFGIDGHMRFQFTVSYTFGYGKKVQRGDEVSGDSNNNSAILK